MKRLALVLIALLMVTTMSAARAASTNPNYTIMLMNKTTGQSWWNASYARNLPSGAGWTDGDRAGYKCAYGFLMYQGQPVGRFTFTTIAGAASYAKVNDKYMQEGARYYNGTVAVGQGNELGQCPPASEAYTPFSGPTQLPTVKFQTTSGTVLETRNYKTLKLNFPGLTFQQVSKTATRVTVVAYIDGLPAIAIYYDALPGSNVVMTSDLG